MPKRDSDAVNQGLNAILGGLEAVDLIGSVIRSDRQRAGRSASPPAPPETKDTPAEEPAGTPDVMTGHNVIGESDNKPIAQADNRTSKQARKHTSMRILWQ